MKTIFLLLFLFAGIVVRAQSPASLIVKVVNEAGKPYLGDKVYFVGQASGKSFSGITDVSGKFKIDLPAGDIYDIRIRAIGDEVEYNTLEIPKLGEGEQFETMELLITYQAATSYTLSSLQFETAKAVIHPASFHMLNELAEIMQQKPALQIEISGHTDSDGDAGANQLLSQQRADAVKDYLIRKGISAARIRSKGYGETKPIATNDSAEGKQVNRRTEVRIL